MKQFCQFCEYFFTHMFCLLFYYRWHWQPQRRIIKIIRTTENWNAVFNLLDRTTIQTMIMGTKNLSKQVSGRTGTEGAGRVSSSQGEFSFSNGYAVAYTVHQVFAANKIPSIVEVFYTISNTVRTKKMVQHRFFSLFELTSFFCHQNEFILFYWKFTSVSCGAGFMGIIRPYQNEIFCIRCDKCAEQRCYSW